jgi:hypothetical protein
VAVTLCSEEVAALKEVDYLLHSLSIGRTEEVDNLVFGIHCLTVHNLECLSSFFIIIRKGESVVIGLQTLSLQP